ncbi:anti-sigma factor family protein [Sulfuriflexus mobilis]|uniref:anti-sigma factor family protein n=1 Tax=Sulfuriflexus mobilis TaxID=1811807 RepID=UPI0018D536F3|nr:anti-sigma factor [Sulfuriflexus mobilis]
MNSQSDNSMMKWVKLHESLQDLLAGYADNELDAQDTLIIEAHLAGCEECRRDLSRQQVLSQRLESITPARMPSSLQQRIETMQLEESPESHSCGRHTWTDGFFVLKNWLNQISPQSLFGASGWAVAMAFALVMLLPSSWQSPSSGIPMINDALAEYHKMSNMAFPVSSKDSGLEAPALWPDARTLATWTTNVAGEPAQVFAIRSGQNIVFQYQINETVLFRNPVVRQAIADSGNYKHSNKKVDVLAFPLSDTGVLVVGPTASLPTPDKIDF